MRYLLDTCLVSELVKAVPNAGVTEWLARHPETDCFLSAITIGELQAGVSKMAASDKQAFLATWLDVVVPQRFHGRVLAVDSTVAQMWGVKRGESAARGVVLPLADAQIAATAIVHGLVVVTRNEIDLQRCGATTVNPWS